MKRAPGCYHNCGKRAANGHLFCTKTCASDWAEEMAAGNGDEWCPYCSGWQSAGLASELLQCGHYRSGQKRGGDKPGVDQGKMDRISSDMEESES